MRAIKRLKRRAKLKKALKHGVKMTQKPHRGASRSLNACLKASEKFRTTGMNRAQRKAEARRKREAAKQKPQE